MDDKIFNGSIILTLPHGGQVIPYFKDSKGKWKIVLVSQYRPAIKRKTFEGAGGRLDLDSESAQEALSRELREETGIKINPEAIKIVLCEYALPSIISGSIIGGIVEIGKNKAKNKRKAGKKSENEQTQVEIFDLADFLKKRERKIVKIDLLTSRLVDETAKAAGLVIKRY